MRKVLLSACFIAILGMSQAFAENHACDKAAIQAAVSVNHARETRAQLSQALSKNLGKIISAKDYTDQAHGGSDATEYQVEVAPEDPEGETDTYTVKVETSSCWIFGVEY
jgi:hypothetical protein